MKMYEFYEGFAFIVKEDTSFEEVADTLLTEALGRLSEDDKRLFVDGVERFGITTTLAGTKACVVKMSPELRRVFPDFSDSKKPLCAALAELEADMADDREAFRNKTVRELLAYYLMPREAWVERKEALRRLETEGLLESADEVTVRIMVGEILYRGFLAAHRLYNSGEDANWWSPRYAPASEISARADAIAERKSNTLGLGRATRKESVAYMRQFISPGSFCDADRVNGLLWAEQHGVAERVYGAHIAEAFRTALGSLGYNAADLEDLGRMPNYPVRHLDELIKRMIAQLEEAC